MDFKDHISHAKMIYQAQPNAFTAAAYQAILFIEKQFTWHPEETAPIGQYVLIYAAADGVDIAEKFEDGHWYLKADYTGFAGKGWKPTHWMPLPEPPKEGL